MPLFDGREMEYLEEKGGTTCLGLKAYVFYTNLV